MRTSILLVLATTSIVQAHGGLAPPDQARAHRYSKRYNTLTGQYETEQVSSKYLLSLNLWGMYSGSGSQTARALSADNKAISWETDWSWSGGDGSVKSYSNVALSQGLPQRLSDVSSIPSTWNWNYQKRTAISANVAYDIWLSADRNCGFAVGCSSHEIMVWVGHDGPAVPAGSKSATVTIGGRSWDLWIGDVQNWKVYSFVASQDLTAYKGDLKEFFSYLSAQQGVSSSLYITTLQAGTEPFTGQAKLTVSSYSVDVLTGLGSGSTSRPASSSATLVKPPKSSSTTRPVTRPATSTTRPASVPSGTGKCAAAYQQCGGRQFIGSACCLSGYTCQVQNEWYSQCVPAKAAHVTRSVASASSPSFVEESPRSSEISAAPSPGPTTGNDSLQSFSGAVNGILAPAITAGGRNYLVEGVDDASFHSLDEAVHRSCDVQHNKCADSFDELPNGAADFSVADCDEQNVACKAQLNVL